MKIFVINGSPKGTAGNTYRLTTAFLKGIRKGLSDIGEEAAVKEVQTARADIRPCLGCFSCWKKTPGQCCIRDDMQEIIENILWADVILWSFPLYYFSVPGGLKNVIDRQLPMVLPFMSEREGQIGNGGHPSRYDMSGKRTVVISTCGFYTAQGNYDGVTSLFDHLCGRGQYETILCGQGELFRVPALSQRTEEYLGYVETAGDEYVKGGIGENTREKLSELLYPRETFEGWADASWGIDRESGEKETEALIFTRQMAMLYRKESYPGKDFVLEMYYTDLDECYQIVLGKDGSKVLTDESATADTRIETPYSVWLSIAAGEIRGDEALAKRLYKVKGDFSLMMNWDAYFSGQSGQKNTAVSEQSGSGKSVGFCLPAKGTSWKLLLGPWMVFWIAAGIDSYVGSFLSIGAAVLLPLLFYAHKKTIYDTMTGTIVAGLSVAVLMGAPERIAMPLSYLCFGMMWTASCIGGKIPLTACYSMNDYGGEDAFLNPLFMKTNRILTMMWGILYLLTPIWTYFIMGTEIGYLTGAVNSALPMAMGIFTAWFQKWYPAKVARGE